MFHCESMCHEAHVKELTCLWVFLTLFFFFFLKYDSIQYTVITISLLDVSLRICIISRLSSVCRIKF